MSQKSQANVPFAVLAMVLAWIVPGVGHAFLGRPARGIIIGLTVAATFWAGVAMGGVMTVDPANERWWFVADMFTGIHGLAGWRLQQRTYDRLTADPAVRQRQATLARDPWQSAAVMDEKLQEERLALTAPTDTVARAYSGIAGLLNLMCIFDVMMLALMGVRGEPPPLDRHLERRATNP
jgi:TM2 domain-containing membrane protein YozV